MATTLQNICDRAVQIAENIGGTFTLDEPTAELLLPHVLKKVFLDAKKETGKIQSYVTSQALTFVDGAANLPAGVMTEFEDYIQLENSDADEEEEISFLRDPYDFNRRLSALFGFFTIRDKKVLYREPGEDAGTFAGDRKFLAVIYPVIPAAFGDAWNLSEDLVNDIVIELARALRGEPPYMNLGDEEEEG